MSIILRHFQVSGERIAEQFRVDRFCQMFVHSRGFGFFHVLVERVGAHRDDRDAAGVGFFGMADGSGGGKPIHQRHADIHKYEVIVMIGVCDKRLYRRKAIFRDLHFEAHGGEEAPGNFDVEQVVLRGGR